MMHEKQIKQKISKRMTDKEFLYMVAQILEVQRSEAMGKRIRLIAQILPLTQTTRTEKDVKLARKTD